MHFIVLVPLWLAVLWIILKIIFVVALLYMLLPFIVLGAIIWFIFELLKDDDSDS